MKSALLSLLLLSLFPGLNLSARIYKDRINPQWANDNSHFWYRNTLVGGTSEYILVDLVEGTRMPAFNQELLAAAINDSGAAKMQPDKLSLDQLQFELNKKLVYFRIGNQHFRWHRVKNQLDKIDASSLPETKSRKEDGKPEQSKPANRDIKPYRPSRNVSPDEKWKAFIKDHNLYIQATSGGEEIALSRDGKPENSYQPPFWSPNSKTLIAFRVEPGKIGDVHLLEYSPGKAEEQSCRLADIHCLETNSLLTS